MRRSNADKNVLRFGDFVVDLKAGELRKGGVRIKLAPQPLKLLGLLVARRGEVVSREEARRELWGDRTYVDVDQGLGASISRIRAVLRDNAAAPRYVETLPRRGYRFIAQVAPPDPAKRMVAVLPLANISGNPDDEYFCEGLTEEIIAELARATSEEFGVIGRMTVSRYRDSQKDVDEISRELDVDYVMEGSVRRYEKRARITLQLLRVEDRAHVWAQAFQRQVDDVLDLQEEIAKEVATAIGAMVDQTKIPLVRARHNNAHAYQAYLKGRFFWNKRTESDIKKAISFFQSAIDIEPSYALAYSGLADAYHMLGSTYVASAVPPQEAFPKAKEAALKAIEINESLAEAHASLGAVLGGYEWDFAGWERECRRAIELDRNYATAHQWYAEFLAASGKLEDALAAIALAEEVDPLSASVNTTAAWILYFARRYEAAGERCRQTLEIHPKHSLAHLYLGLVFEQTGSFDEALQQFRKARRWSSEAPEAIAAPGRTFALMGKRREAESVIAELQAAGHKKYVSGYLFAKVHAALGQHNEAFAMLRRAVRDRSDWLLFSDVDPCLETLHGDERFRKLRRAINLPG